MTRISKYELITEITMLCDEQEAYRRELADQSAANGDSYNADAADGKVNHIMDAAHACFCGEPFPIGDTGDAE